MTKVSIIVPVYNVEKYLSKCLTSLVKQTLKDIEIIIVNDGTQDKSQDIIDKYKKKYKNIKSYKKENGGLSSARNYGLVHATGEYIAFVDSDDWVELDMYEKMYNKAKELDFDIVVCDTKEIDENGNIRIIKSNFNFSNDIVKNYIISPPMACIRLYKKSLKNKLKFLEGIYYEDLNLMPSLVLYTKKIGFLEEPLYNYFQRKGSIMKQLNFNERLLDIFDVLEKNYNFLNQFYKKEVEYLYIIHLLRTASLRFLNYKNSKKHLIKINKVIKEKYPNWYKNIYYKKSSYKFKIVCNLAYNNHCFLLKNILKLRR